ncbi:MAG: DEAD/DEAH box helicase family protein [Chloroflexota bacterium]|nr:DEAD/DEAH box helicase family protein [Chloroflexota bacterium]
MARPEDDARQHIDTLLTQAGWSVQDRKNLNLGAARGIALREFSMSTGIADYLLFVNREAVGIVEAKKVGATLTGVEEQSAKYRSGLAGDFPTARLPLPFTYETTGIETRFTNHLEPEPRSRPVFAFHQPATLATWLTQAPPQLPNEQNNTLRARLRRLPPLPSARLRACQVEAITNLERSFAANHPRALIQMATGSGKTYTAVSSVYRLLKFGGAKRVLFLVDRANLAKQTLNEFAQYATPDDGRKFTELYNVQHLQHNSIDMVANVCITTIQRLYSILSGEPELDASVEERSLFDMEDALAKQPPRKVHYNPHIPIESFDVVIIDECHRSIYHLWRAVLDYFDAFIVGLTATPNKQTFGFFNRNLVMEYGHDRAVADGVNVDYQVFRLRTEITEQGSTIEPLSVVGKRERQTRAVRWEQLDEDLVYAASQLDRDVVAPDQVRTVIRAFRDALPTAIFPGRQEVPKTLIFAKDDSHAELIVDIVRAEFARGNEFAQKITYKTTGVKPEDLIASFRNSYYPRVAVTVDMISTGTDIKPLEVLLFMRSVRSRGFFEQMKGRGSRTISDTDFQAVNKYAASKTHFVIVDAVGVCEQVKTDSPPLERKPSIPLKQLLDDVAIGKWRRDPDLLPTLAGRLGRLARLADPIDTQTIMQETHGLDIPMLARRLLEALDPDTQLETARAESGQDYLRLDDPAVQQVAQDLLLQATLPFDNPQLRTALLNVQRDDQTIDVVSQDTLLSAAWDLQAEERARQVVTTFRQFIEQHRDEITALEIFYNRPSHAPLKLADIKQLARLIEAPPLGLSTDKLWQAYETLERSRVRGSTIKRLLTDLVALIRYTIEREQDSTAVLEPYTASVRRRFAAWLAEQEQRRARPFTAEERLWLEMVRDRIASSLSIETNDFDLDPFIQRGGLGKAYTLFGPDLPKMLQDLNERLAA